MPYCPPQGEAAEVAALRARLASQAEAHARAAAALGSQLEAAHTALAGTEAQRVQLEAAVVSLQDKLAQQRRPQPAIAVVNHGPPTTPPDGAAFGSAGGDAALREELSAAEQALTCCLADLAAAEARAAGAEAEASGMRATVEDLSARLAAEQQFRQGAVSAVPDTALDGAKHLQPAPPSYVAPAAAGGAREGFNGTDADALAAERDQAVAQRAVLQAHLLQAEADYTADALRREDAIAALTQEVEALRSSLAGAERAAAAASVEAAKHRDLILRQTARVTSERDAHRAAENQLRSECMQLTQAATNLEAVLAAFESEKAQVGECRWRSGVIGTIPVQEAVGSLHSCHC